MDISHDLLRPDKRSSSMTEPNDLMDAIISFPMLVKKLLLKKTYRARKSPFLQCEKLFLALDKSTFCHGEYDCF